MPSISEDLKRNLKKSKGYLLWFFPPVSQAWDLIIFFIIMDRC